MVNARLLIARTLTPAHFGVGRAPGAVDLPIARDSMGYPIMPASSVKGALKRMCGVRHGCIARDREGRSKLICSCNSKDGCGAEKTCPICCCLFGAETGDKGASALSVLDLLLLAVPAPSRTHGWVYITSEYLIKRLLDIATNLMNEEQFSELLNEGLGSPPLLIGDGGRGEDEVEVSVFDMDYVAKATPNTNVSELLKDLIKGVSGLASELGKRLLILPDKDAVHLINRSVIRYWRVRLDYEKKVVTAGPWSEEYVPPDAVFVGAVADTGWRNEFCARDLCNAAEKLENVFGNEITIVLGGKESVGKGLVKLYLR